VRGGKGRDGEWEAIGQHTRGERETQHTLCPAKAIATQDIAHPSLHTLARSPLPGTPIVSSAHAVSHCLKSGYVIAPAPGRTSAVSAVRADPHKSIPTSTTTRVISCCIGIIGQLSAPKRDARVHSAAGR
jgi:hypothetical protein